MTGGRGKGVAKDLSIEEFERFRDHIHRHSGIYLEETKLDSLRISLLTRATRLSCRDYDEYFTTLANSEDEFKELLNLITINETSFFRFPAQFDALRDRVIPEIMAAKAEGSRSLRCWSAGCSTGEEPYSIAMTLLQANVPHCGWRVEVLGTDVSTHALEAAKAATYATKSLANLDDAVVRRFFERADAGYRVRKEVRSLVDFGYHNLIKEPYPLSLMGNWDVIFCRNVTIYFRLESTRRVVANFYSSLNPGGYLFVGHSETLTSVSEDFQPLETGGVFLYRKPSPGHVPFSVGSPKKPEGKSRSRGAERERWRAQLKEKLRGGREDRAKSEKCGKTRDAASGNGLLGEARALLADGHLDEMHEKLKEALEAEPNNAEAHILSAYAYADGGDYTQALAECHRALAVNPLIPAARYILGIIHQREGDQVRAISEFKKTIYIDPEFVLAHLNLGNIYRSQAKYDAAAREYENAALALHRSPEGPWCEFLGGFKADLLTKTCERSLIECRKAMGQR